MQISILGCGWLGLPLAEALVKIHTVKGSVTTAAKLPVLQEKGILPFQVDLNSPDADTITGFLHGSDVLVIAIPPKVRAEGAISYPDKLNAIVPYIVSAGIKKVLFTSSISVYGENEAVPEVDELTEPNPQTESGKQVLAAERVLQSCNDFSTTIVRLGGLVGGERHPVYHLSGRENIENPQGPVNLINRDECVEILVRIIQQDFFGEVFTAVHPEAKNREAFYTDIARELGLALPAFNNQGTTKGKIVKGQDKLKRLLGFTFS